jgi:hypothetical protein
VLTADQVTAIAPDAASLKAGRGLATARKWQLLGGDPGALWGLAIGSGKDPYQTRVDLSDLASKCSCPSRKFPCKHAIGLMLVAIGEPAALTTTARPDWLAEWLDSRAGRQEKQRQRENDGPKKEADPQAAARRRAKKRNRIDDGVALMGQTLRDLAREGLASATARDAAHWHNLQRRMIDCQAPGLAAAARTIADDILHAADADEALAHEFGRLHLLCESHRRSDELDPGARAEISTLLGDGPGTDEVLALPPVEDAWFVVTREFRERDRLLTSMTWLWGTKSRRWAKVLRFAHLPATLAEPWPLGSTVDLGVSFDPALVPRRARPHGDGHARHLPPPAAADPGFDALLESHGAALAASPFLHASPFLLEVRPDDPGFLADAAGRRLPWRGDETTALRVDAITGGVPTLAAGDWNGRHLRLLAIADGAGWVPLVNLQSG